jgi:ATP-binding cassette subfamily B protein
VNASRFEEAKAKELSFAVVFKKLWPFLWAHKGQVILSGLLVVFYSAIGRSVPLIFGRTVDEVIERHHLEMLYLLAGIYFAVEVARTSLEFWQSYQIQRLGNVTLYEIREKLMSHVQRLPLSYFDKNPSGRTVTRVTNDVLALGDFFSQGVAGISVSVFEMGTIFLTMLFLSWKLTLCVSVLVPLLWFFCLKISQKIRLQYGVTKRKLSAINAFSAEHLTGMKVIQLFNRETAVKGQFQKLSDEYKASQIKTIGYLALLWPSIEGFSILMIALALFFGALFKDNLQLTVGTLTAFIILLQNFFRPMRIILEKYNNLQNSLSSADRVFQLLDEAEEVHFGSHPLARSKGEIRFQNLNFAYGDGPLVLKNINLTIPAGTSVALVGRTGSGKSTTISLLQRLYEYREGHLLLDGVELKDIPLRDLRRRIGVVQQDNFIFSGNFYTNIGLNDAGISKETMEWAAREAQCLEMIERHGGFEAEIFERGSNLSHGERQLLAFSRVLAFNPDVLVLDEATANIDSISEHKIQKAMEKVIRGRTSVIIAHRLSTILKCDQIVVLSHGEIVEMGRHEELLQQGGVYATFYRSQQASLEEGLPV